MKRESARSKNFSKLGDHHWYKKLFKKLTLGDHCICQRFIDCHEHLDDNDFEKAVNRMFLDKPRPKNFAIIMELLAVTKTK